MRLRVAPLLFFLLTATGAHAGAPGPLDPELRQLLKAAIEEAESFEDRFAAEVWLKDMSTRLEDWVDDPAERLKILRLVHREAKRADIPPELVLAVIETESSFNRFAVSSAGARGLMQIMPFWLEEIGHPEDNLFHMDTNLRMGCTILKYYLDMEDGNLRDALARYNGSLGRRTYPDKVFRALSKRWFRQ